MLLTVAEASPNASVTVPSLLWAEERGPSWPSSAPDAPSDAPEDPVRGETARPDRSATNGAKKGMQHETEKR